MTDETRQAARRVREVWAASDAAWDQLEAAASAALATPPRGFEGVTPDQWEGDPRGLSRTWSLSFGDVAEVWVEDRVDTNGSVSRTLGTLEFEASVEINTAEELAAYWTSVQAAASKFAEVQGAADQ